jgi:uncharacterized membrane protein YsdA (DUF1294 family)
MRVFYISIAIFMGIITSILFYKFKFPFLIAYFISVNIATFFVFGVDKILAIKQKIRVPEKTLHTLSFIGGFTGALIGKYLFRHKINKKIFYLIEVFNILAFIIWLTFQ